MGKTKDLSKDCKNIVLNLFKFFQLEKARGRPFYTPDNLIKRTCKAAGISYSSVYRVVNGKSPPESNRPKERKKTLDDFDRCVIKRTVHSMYNRKIAPTVSKIKKEIEDTIKISKSTLTLTLLDLGYKYKKSGDNRRLLYDQRSVINDRCNYLRKIRKFREDGYEIVYLDETWVNQNHATDYMWLPVDGYDAPKIPSGKGKRLIVLHAGNREEGLIDRCDLVFLATAKDGDYHQEMNGPIFLNWFENQLMPALKSPSVIVLDNASYHNIKTEETVVPNFNQRKAVLQDYLSKHNIPFQPLETKKQLYEKIKFKKLLSVFKTDKIANLHGHEVLRTPVRHCELNPIELIWAEVKGFVAENNTTFRLKDVKELVYGGFGRITKEVWAKAEDHVLKIEKEHWKENCIDRSEISPIIIDFDDDESSDEES